MRVPVVLFDVDGTITESRKRIEKHVITALRELSHVAEIAKSDYDIPFTGHHIQNRNSMFNWCPIGRNADHGERKQFVAMDKMYGIRNKFLMDFKRLMFDLKIDNVEIKLAGDTSFDIFPKGWDKTYVFNHFPQDEWELYFVGDRCYPNGNDYEIYNALSHDGRAFETSGPEETVEIIDIHLLRMLDAD